MLKLLENRLILRVCFPAAFGRLCVETADRTLEIMQSLQPPSGGCVLKLKHGWLVCLDKSQPPSGGCVLKLSQTPKKLSRWPSRLRAAVC